ncbi:MAG: septum formation inhibitor Maf [Myxococcales bacterium]|nr:septum formation inhibitor Maf [Myxococcales bacterium]
MLILASASPRRRELLTSVGITFTVRPADTDEIWLGGELPRAYVLRVARAKARAVYGAAADRAGGAAPLGFRVLAADTTVAIEDRVLGKPTDQAHARAMLGDLSAREHAVHTAVVLIEARASGSAGEKHRIVTTRVRFRALTPGEIAAYVETGESADKAGAYGIQGRGGALVDVVHGSYTNVVGLPLAETLELLASTVRA